jgi:hypothetical protein
MPSPRSTPPAVPLRILTREEAEGREHSRQSWVALWRSIAGEATAEATPNGAEEELELAE